MVPGPRHYAHNGQNGVPVRPVWQDISFVPCAGQLDGVMVRFQMKVYARKGLVLGMRFHGGDLPR